ncbi:uncharacterized protein LOC113359857 [Papaver somniferum]|uniref:uncharacterized protein LOC113359857 n=1 Tax=Papaver somniferum TaxID=3469 RepID=UPI000E7057DF|nr:uncharacterized protein LOC113359857 [Papaver somniferum]
MICELEDVDGNIVADQGKISDILVNFFQQKFQAQEVTVNDPLLDVIPKLITDEDQAMIEVIHVLDEIKNAVFDINADGAPAKISAMINGGPQGFFSMERGLKKGDPLSPLLFVLMEEVLSKKLSKLVEMKKLQPMVVRKGVYPTHLFFADDVFIFSNGSKKSLESLINLLNGYQECSGQIINKQKSKCFVDGCTPLRKSQISSLLQMELTSFPDKYLGVILKPGRVKSATMWPMVDMMQSYLTAWKGKMLSFHDRLVLIKSVLCSVPIYDMAVYKWPSSVIKVCEKIIRNFLWTGDSEVKKYDTFGLSKVCIPFNEGGLGIRRLEVINKALLMKIMWKLINSNDDWSRFFAAKYKDKYGQWCTQWKLSTVWPGLKWAWKELKQNLRWSVGTGKQITLWFDAWAGEKSLTEFVGIIDAIKDKLHMTMNDILVNGEWKIPSELQAFIPSSLPAISGEQEKLIWSGDIKGIYSTSAAVEKVRTKEPRIHWPDQIWKKFLHPGIDSNIWKIQKSVYVDGAKLIKKGYSLASKCCICQQDQDSMEHILWFCNFSKFIWKWLVAIFQFQPPTSFSDVLKSAKQKSSIIKQVWLTAACATMRELWFQKNKLIHENIIPNVENFKRRILSLAFYGGFRMTGTRWGQNYDSDVLNFFNLGQRSMKFRVIKECQWSSPNIGYPLFCCVGSVIGNPGMAGFGIIARNHNNQVIGTVSGGIRVATSYIADVLAIVWDVEWDAKLQCSKVLIRVVPKSVIEDFSKSIVPWCLHTRWIKEKRNISEIIFEQCYKEVNFYVIELAKKGTQLHQGNVEIHTGKPPSLVQVELPGRKYYIFC